MKKWSFWLLLVIFWALILIAAYKLARGQAPWSNAGTPPPGDRISTPVVYFLDADNSLWTMRGWNSRPARELSVIGVNGHLIGIDFRPADKTLYALNNVGTIYT